MQTLRIIIALLQSPSSKMLAKDSLPKHVWVFIQYPPHNNSREMSPTLSFSVCVFFFSVLPKDTLIPYCGVLCLHEVNPQDPTVPMTLLPGVEAGWNRMVELGHQPVVLEDGRVVRKFYNFTFAIAMKMLPIV